MTIFPCFSLIAHSDFRNAAVRAIDGRVSLANGTLTVIWTLEEGLERLRIPPWTGHESGARLWEHTCFEIFVSRAGADAYHELNFAPSGAWAAYAFERYREGAPLPDVSVDPEIVVRGGRSTFELEASIRLERLSGSYLRAPLALGLSAVIEDCQGGLSYWALAHPAGKPDFHHRDGFVFNLSDS